MKRMKNNYRLTIQYDGTRYFGWEHQPNTDMTIQGKIEAVLARMTGEDIEVLGAGRTYAGVHAKAMVANCMLATELTEKGYESINEVRKQMIKRFMIIKDVLGEEEFERFMIDLEKISNIDMEDIEC